MPAFRSRLCPAARDCGARKLAPRASRKGSQARSSRSRCAPNDRGESLLELLVAMMLMGTALVVLLGGLGTSINISRIHREQALAGTFLRAFAESIATEVAATPSGYVDCASTTSYNSIYDTGDPTYAPTVAAIGYWNGTAFVATCTTDTGVQRLTLQVSTVDTSVTERLDIVIRRPCRVGEALCS